MAHKYDSECAFKSIEDIKGKKVTVMGLGLNGGGLAAVRFFLQKGAEVTVTDMKSEEQLRPTVDAILSDSTLDLSRLTFRLGKHCIQDFEGADCVIKNPGVKYDGNQFLAAAKAIETDLSIFLRFSPSPIIAVTGSKGKSSTVSALYWGLRQAGFNAFLGGNITVSPLSFFDETGKDTPVVIEFSSWQLSDLRGRGILKPHIAIITKIVPDHQNWYGNMEDYVADKRLIYHNQDEGDFAIFDAEADEDGTGPADGGTWGDLFARESRAAVLRYGKCRKSVADKNLFGVWQEETQDKRTVGYVFLPGMKEPEIIMRDLSVPGEHMKTNVLNAALVMYLMGVKAEKTAEICGKWTGIDHRLQFFYRWKNELGREYAFYNDSCATVPEAAAAATRAFEKPVTLIAGGTDKGLDLAPLAKVLGADKNGPAVKTAYLLEGSATDKLLALLPFGQKNVKGPYSSLESLLSDLKCNINNSELKESGEEIVVFSPGATSFGMFKNEFDRGNQFMQAVKKLFK